MNSNEERGRSLWARKFDVLSFLSKVGLKTLGMKLFACLLVFTGLSIGVASVAAYVSLGSAIESSGQLSGSASVLGETVDRLIYENIQFAKSIANDETLVRVVEEARAEAEAAGVRAIPAPGETALLEERYSSTHVLKRRPEIDNFLQDRMRVKSSFSRMFVADRYGLNVAMTTMTEDFVQSDEQWWQETMRSGMYIADVEFDEPTQLFTMEICVAIPSKAGGWNGVLKVEYNLSDVQEFLSHFKQYDSGYTFAISSGGLLILHPNPEMRNLGMNEAFAKSGVKDSSLAKSILEFNSSDKKNGVVYYEGMNPETKRIEQRIAAYGRPRHLINDPLFSGFDWIYVVDNSKDEVYAPAYKMVRYISIAGVIVFLIIGALALFFAKGFSGGVEELLRATEEISTGNLDARVSLSTRDELEKVGHGINHMMDRLAEMARSEASQKEALQESEANFRGLFDDAPVGYHEIDREGRIVRINQTELSMLGYSAEEMVGAFVADFAAESDFAQIIRNRLAGDVPEGAYEKSFRRKDGSLIRVLIEDALIRKQDSSVAGIRSTIQDISARKEMEDALKESERHYRNLFDNANDAIVILEPGTEMILEANQRASQMYGVAKEELVGMSLKSFVREGANGGHKDSFLTSISSAIEAGGSRNFETIHYGKKGNSINLAVGCSLIDYADRKAIFGVFRDITESKRFEEMLRQSEEKYRSILENIEAGYYEIDLKGTMVFFNEPVERILGYPAADLKGLPYRHYVEPDVAQEVYETFNRAFRTGKAIRDFTYLIRQKDGSKRFVETSFSLIRDAEGKAAGFRGMIRDVTERLEAERTLTRDLKEFLDTVSAVSEGDLTLRGKESESTLGEVIKSVNKMLDNFSQMLTQVKQVGLSVSSSATEILAAAEQIAVGSQRQVDETANTSSSVEEMAATMSQVSRNAESSAESARLALGMAERGDNAVRDMTEAITRIESAVQQTSQKMRILGLRSSEISEILDLITDIAAQTNLLSLNAAIEAAHAGEAGLGFSVVAEEIRKLAEKSTRATKDVGNLVKTIQSETSEALSAMEVGLKEVQSGSHMAGQGRSTFQAISDAVRESSGLMEEICAASEEQARVTNNLAGAMQTISSITLETSAGAHETAQTIQGMVGLSEQLNLAISRFRVRDDFIHPFSYDVPMNRDQGSGVRSQRSEIGD
ncbi:MAG: PAS domain S-box protein [Blastocatellia bacterium]|nr:PAS domain S-box protein [Blastocatellia bacterium]